MIKKQFDYEFIFSPSNSLKLYYFEGNSKFNTERQLIRNCNKGNYQ